MKNTLLSAAIIAALGFSVTLHANQQEQETTTGTTNNPTTGNTIDNDVNNADRNRMDRDRQDRNQDNTLNETDRDMNREDSRPANALTTNETNRNLERYNMDDNAIEAEEFVETAAAKGIAEVETARMALDEGSPALHGFANKMIEDHSAANDELRAIAQAEGLEVADDPTLMDRAKAMILSVRSGESFDEAYINNQIEAHEETIELFERGARSDHPEVRTFAQNKLPVLQEHLRMANDLKAQHMTR